MSEQTVENFDDVFDEWIAGASLTKRSTTVFGRPDLVAEMQQIEEALDHLERESDGEESAGDPRRAELIGRATEIHETWLASKSVWTVRAIGDEDTKAVTVIVGDAPRAKNPKQPTEAESKAAEAHADETNLRLLSRAVVEIEFADGRKASGATYEQLVSLMGRIGKPQILRLIAEVNQATYAEPVVPAPKLRSGSATDEG